MKTEVRTTKTQTPKKKKTEHQAFLWGTFSSVLLLGGIIVTIWVLMWNLWLSR